MAQVAIRFDPATMSSMSAVFRWRIPASTEQVLKAVKMIEYSFNEQYNLFIWKPKVVIDLQLLLEAISTTEELKAQRGAFNRFVNISDILGISLHAPDLEDIARRRSAYDGPVVKAAYFTPHALSIGIGRMLQSLIKNKQLKIEVFGNIQSCANWLDVPQEILEAKSD